MKKTHNVDNTLMHMRAWQASATARQRYYSEKYADSGVFLDSANNELLRKSRAAYDTAYSQSLYDLYKYLNSSVIGISDILSLTLDEAKAKGKLLKEGVNIFASRKQEIKEARDKQIQQAQAEHDAAVAKAKETKQKNQNGKDIDSSSGRNQHEQDLFKDDTGAALTGNVSNGDDSSKDSSSDSNSDQATDEQYKNDLEYLKSKGYTEEAANAELAKLPQYKDRLGSKDSSSSSDTNSASSGSNSDNSPSFPSSSVSRNTQESVQRVTNKKNNQVSLSDLISGKAFKESEEDKKRHEELEAVVKYASSVQDEYYAAQEGIREGLAKRKQKESQNQ